MNNSKIINCNDPEIAIVDGILFLGGYLLAIVMFGFIIPPGFPHAWGVSVSMSVIIWTYLFFFHKNGGIFKRCLKIVPDNQAWIIANALKKELVPSGGSITRNRQIRAQRAIQSGPELVYPWEYLAPEGIIDMTKQPLGDKNTRNVENSFTTKDDNQVSVDYGKIFWSVIPGYEVNHFRFLQDADSESDIADYLEGMLEVFLQGYCRRKNMKELIGNLADVQQAFVSEFLQGRPLRDTEENIGAQITDGVISRISPSKELKKIMESEQEGVAILKSAKRFKKRYKALTDKETLNYALIAADKRGIDIRAVDENFNITGLPEGMQFFNKGTMPGEALGKGGNPGQNPGK